METKMRRERFTNEIPNFKQSMYVCQWEGCEHEFVKYKSTDKFCKKHYYESAKLKRQAQVSKQSEKVSKKARKPIKTKKIDKGELRLFIQIWNERPKISELSGKPLLPIGHPQWHFQFLHCLNKGRFPSMRLEKENILLALPDEHEKQDTFKVFQDRKIKLLNKIYKK